MTQRHIPLSGTPNLRDLGGYTTRCGRKVKHNKLFRSGTLAYLTEQDWQTLSSLNIGVICDFRHADERKYEVTQLPKEMPAQIIHLDINAGNHVDFIRKAIEWDTEDNETIQRLMRDINRMFALNCQHAYRSFFAEIRQLQNEQALLFHCSAGKDRTGFASALILMCLNVDHEVIMQDYMLSEKYYVPDIEIPNIIERWQEFDLGLHDPQRLKPMLQVQPDYIGAAFDAIKENYSSTEDYLFNAFAIDKQTIKNLQDTLLE